MTKRTPVSRAVTAVLGSMGVMGAVQAVNLNDMGEVGISPYYTVQGDKNTFIQIVNTTSDYKAVKVRFREGINSYEVLDFNLYLSPNDVWTGSVSQAEGGDAAVLNSNDNSCTVPAIPRIGEAGVPFKNALYKGDPADHDGLDRTREGYFEVIEMATFDSSVAPNLAADVLHDSSGEPGDWDGTKCAQLNNSNNWQFTGGVPVDFSSGDRYDAALTGFMEPQGGLIVESNIVGYTNGEEISVPVVMMDNFMDIANHSGTGQDLPTLSSVSPATSNLLGSVDGGAIQMVSDSWSATSTNANAVSALMMTESLVNQYKVNPALAGETDWVVTLPTKHFYVPQDPETPLDADVDAPFTDSWDGGSACEEVSIEHWDREEQQTETSNELDFSPITTPEPDGSYICNEVNVMNVDYTGTTGVDSDVLGSTVLDGTMSVAFNSGWARMYLNAAGQSVESDGFGGDGVQRTYSGLPAIGFSTTRRTIGQSGGAYAAAFEHKYERSISGSLN